MAARPIIGVTGPRSTLAWAWWATRWQLLRAGAEPMRLVPGNGPIRPDYAGFVIGGGNDIDPAIYGGDVSTSRSLNPERDRFELDVLAFADRHELPVMGICRGSQLINVHAGGTLVADLKPHRRHTSNRGTLLPRKRVHIAEHSTLRRFIGRDETRVNSLHKQAVERTADGLRAVAWDRDDIVQGIESESLPLRLGVQWHPEYLPQRPDQRRLFRQFVRACE